jgi:hypothetical protein
VAFLMALLALISAADRNRAKMTGDRSYSDLSDSATTFDPEEQFDRDRDSEERLSKLEDEILARLDDVDNSLSSYNTSQLITGIGLAALIVVCVLWISMKG